MQSLRRLPLRPHVLLLLRLPRRASSTRHNPTTPPHQHPTTSTTDAASRGDGVTPIPAPESAPPLPAGLLPTPGREPAAAAAAAGLPSLRVDGDALKLDAMGPLVVNADGSVGRVANWNEMTAAEREGTLKLLKRRNRERLAKLKGKGAGDDGAA